MRAETLKEILDAIERRDWTEAMTIATTALEQASRMQEGSPIDTQREKSGQYFDQTYKAFG